MHAASRIVWGILILSLLGVLGCPSDDDRRKPGKRAPEIGAPTGPGTVIGARPSHAAAVLLGDPLGFDVTVTDRNRKDDLTFTADVTGGSLTPAQAGLLESFPITLTGTSPLTITCTGTSLATGDVQIAFTVDDGDGGYDSITHRIHIVESPRIVQVDFVDGNHDCQMTAGDDIDVTFSRDVTVAAGATPENAFQLLPPATAPFGLNPAWITTSGVVLRFELGASPSIEVNGIFGTDPLASGIDVGVLPEVIYDTNLPPIHATQIDPVNPGMDVTGTTAASLLGARYVDDGDGIFGAGDFLEVDFCAYVDVQGGTPDTEFLLPVAGDSFGTGAAFQGTLPLQNVGTVVIVLGTDPVMQANGMYDPAVLSPGSPSAIDLHPTQTEILISGTATLVQPMIPPGMDILGPQAVGQWSPVASPMTEPRRAHTATLLPNGEVLIVGGFNDQATGPNPFFFDVVSTIEIFDPAAGTFSPAPGSLVSPRAQHDAVRTPGPDGVIDTSDDYVVIVGGWNSMVVENYGPRSEGTVEVIWPDPDGNGDTSDLVVNWSPGGPPWTSSGVAPADLGTRSFLGVGPPPGCMDVTITLGMQGCTFSWVPEYHHVGPGNNEMMAIGGVETWIWDDCQGGLRSEILYTAGGTACEDQRYLISVDADNDGDLFDTAIGEGCSITTVGFGVPWTAPRSFQRTEYSQTRVPGIDGQDGTADDAFWIYGGYGFDVTQFCMGPPPCGSVLGNLEYFDVVNFGPLLPNNNDAYSSCGLLCSVVGGPTDRMRHSAVLLPGPAQEIVLLAGWSTAHAMAGIGCTMAAEIITPDLSDPMRTTIRSSGIDVIEQRVRGQCAEALPASGNVILAGGFDNATSGATASAAYLQVAFDRFDPVPDMSEARWDAASVTIPGGVFPGIPEDRAYFFGGWDDGLITLDTVEYFTD